MGKLGWEDWPLKERGKWRPILVARSAAPLFSGKKQEREYIGSGNDVSLLLQRL